MHLKVAGDVVMPGVPMNKRLAGLVRSGLFYLGWYPSRWFGWGHWPQYSEFGALAGHMRWAERTSRRLARQQFHLMVLNGPALEKKQALLFRCVDIGAELFAILATCVRAVRDVKSKEADANAIDLADVFCRHSRRKVDKLFGDIRRNADGETYRVARAILDQKYEWLENGIIDAPEAAAQGAEAAPRRAAAGS